MSSVPDRTFGQMEKLLELEATLLGHIEDATGELQRIECLDEEQRAEIYSILEAMKHDGRSHVTIVRNMTDKIAGESLNA